MNIIAELFTLSLVIFLYSSLMVGIPIVFNKVTWAIFDFINERDTIFLQDIMFIMNGGNPIEILTRLKSELNEEIKKNE